MASNQGVAGSNPAGRTNKFMMRTAVFGANGKVGRLVVAEALERGHTVTAFVHNKSNLTEHKNLKIVQGDIFDQDSVATAVKGSDAVISALGSWGTKSKDIVKVGAANISKAMLEHNVQRIITLTGHGANAPGDKFDPLHEISRLMLRVGAPKILDDGEAHIVILNQTNLKWTAVRSPLMIGRGNPLKYKVTNRRPWPLSIISRGAVANALLDLAETNNYVGQAPFIKRT